MTRLLALGLVSLLLGLESLQSGLESLQSGLESRQSGLAPLMFGAAADLPDGSILSIDRSLAYNTAIQLFNVAVLTAILTFLLYKPVKRYLADRKKRIRNEIEDARRCTDEAQSLKEKYERMIAKIEAEREEILLQTHKNAVEKSDQLLFEARREAEAIFHRVKSELDLEREILSDEIKRQIIEIAHVMAGRFIQVSIDRETQDRLIEQALDEWDSAEGEGEAGPSRSGAAGRRPGGSRGSAPGDIGNREGRSDA